MSRIKSSKTRMFWTHGSARHFFHSLDWMMMIWRDITHVMFWRLSGTSWYSRFQKWSWWDLRSMTVSHFKHVCCIHLYEMHREERCLSHSVMSSIHFMLSMASQWRLIGETHWWLEWFKLNHAHLNEAEEKIASNNMKVELPHGIPQCWANSLRLSLCTFTGLGGRANLNMNVVVSYRNFCNKIWNAVKFAKQYFFNFNGVRLNSLSPADS